VLTRAKRDYYAILGVPRDADQDVIKKAFRSLASTYHPDVSTEPDAEDRFREALEAYEVLSSPEARVRYDRRGFGRRPPSPPRRSPAEPGAPKDPLDDLFDFLAPAPAPGQRGADLAVQVALDAEEARRGTTRGVRFTAWSICDPCAGEGARPGSRWRTCGSCAGAGRVREAGRAANGRLIRLRACGRCRGLGRVVDDPCAMCGGRGRLEEERALLVRFPGGATDGQELRLEGQGHAGGRGGAPGDVVVHFAVPPGADGPLLRRLARAFVTLRE
jgi:molecular chaperone DnaJ